MKKYAKKPVQVEAHQLRLTPAWYIGAVLSGDIRLKGKTIQIHTLEGWMTANEGDYVVQGVDGEIYAVKKDIFEKTYEQVA